MSPAGTRAPSRFCTIGECEKLHKGHGMCDMHLWRFRKYGTAEPEHYKPRLCELEGCLEKHAALGYCKTHWYRFKTYGDPLEVRKFDLPATCYGCETGKPVARGFCSSCYAKDWKRRNPARYAMKEFRNRVSRAAAIGHFTDDQLAARFDFYGGLCWICQDAVATTIDHVKPVIRGGTNWPANLRPACLGCNMSKNKTWPFSVPSRPVIPGRLP